MLLLGLPLTFGDVPSGIVARDWFRVCMLLQESQLTFGAILVFLVAMAKLFLGFRICVLCFGARLMFLLAF